MTILRLDNNIERMKGRAPSSPALQKHWGSTQNVIVSREPNSSLGISIVGGRVDLRAQDSPGNTTLGIFVKSVVPNSPAGKTGKFKTGDRILEVNGVSLDHSSHEDAVNIIRNSKNPVTFVIQSLIPWIENDDSIRSDGPSPLPSPLCNNISNNFTEKINQEASRNDINKSESSNFLKHDNNLVSPSLQPSGPPSLAVTPEPTENANQNRSPSPYLSESEEEDDEDDARLMEGRTMSAAGVQIDRASAGNVKRSKEEIQNDPEKEDDFGYTMSKSMNMSFFIVRW
ncbi:hypothetical protein HHI36_003173 [Cryptolaemus montrouzieri]|uniref:PDZ domain-containing protein n=1 Tax=Cryptolaemus montrouzieri TaxID=559131 RepID=A0ABD2PCN2_9CUCU